MVTDVFRHNTDTFQRIDYILKLIFCKESHLKIFFNSLATNMVVNDHMKHYVIERQFTGFLFVKSYEQDSVCSNNHIR